MKEIIDAVLKAEDELTAKARISEGKILEISENTRSKIENMRKKLEDNLIKEKNKKFESLDRELRAYREKLEAQLKDDIRLMESYLLKMKKDIQARIIKTIIGVD
jgi:ribosome recycling factor